MRKLALSVLVILVLIAACASATFTRDAYRTLTVSQQAYDVTLSTMGDLYREGNLTETQKAKAVELGRAYKLAHNGALAALVRYEELGGDQNKQAYLAAAQDAAKALSELLAYCRPLLQKGGK